MPSPSFGNGTDDQNVGPLPGAPDSCSPSEESPRNLEDAAVVATLIDTTNGDSVRDCCGLKSEELNLALSDIPEEAGANGSAPPGDDSPVLELTADNMPGMADMASEGCASAVHGASSKNIPPTVEANTNKPRTIAIKKKLFKSPRERALVAAENERRLEEAGELFRQSLIINSPAPTTPQSATSARPPKSHSDDNFEILETGHQSSPIELDTEAEDASAVARFKSYKRSYEHKKKKNQTSVEDDIAFSKTRNEEQHRLKLRSRKRAYRDVDSGTEGDDTLFIAEETLSAPVDTCDRVDHLETLTDTKRPRGRPNKIPESALHDATQIGYDALEAEGRKMASKKHVPKKLRKNKVPKDPKTGISKSQDKDREPKPKRSRRRKGPEMLNIQTLFNNDIVSAAQANMGKAAQPGFTSTNKKAALAELIASIPEGERTTHNADKNALDKATRSFTGHAAMKADGNNGWRLRGMATSLYHYQLLGAAFMRDRENSSTRPYGGLQSDEMGLGKTVTCLANIIDGQAPPKSPNRTTLIVCPAGLCSQWLSEIKKHVLPGTFEEVLVYRAGARVESTDPTKTLSNMDIIITSYSEVMRSYPHCQTPRHLVTPEAKEKWWFEYFSANRGVLHKIFFRRIVLDEGMSNCYMSFDARIGFR